MRTWERGASLEASYLTLFQPLRFVTIFSNSLDLGLQCVVRPWPVLSEPQRFVVEAVAVDPTRMVRRAAERFGLTPQAVNHQIRRLSAQGVLRPEGKTRQRRYALATLRRLRAEYPLGPGLAEDRAWQASVAPLLAGLPANVLNICRYGFTEVVNNAVEHSGGTTVRVSLEASAAWVTLTIADDGVGAFAKIRQVFGLEDDRHALLELSKGKLTTDPARHTGESLYITCRMFDEVVLRAGRVALVRRRRTDDWAVDEGDSVTGTQVTLRLRPWADQTDREILDRYAFGFRRTRVIVALAQPPGSGLMSRSEARRMMARLDRFIEVVLDFKGVASIGPAFADEVFRVYASTHAVKLIWVRASEDIQRMIRRAESDAPDP
jgi:anti-sigma regulatory factor (Ser/Thr protein kinase)